MKSTKCKCVGILGGMGPEATAELFLRIIRRTRASCDQDHLRVIIDSNSKIPDRSTAILQGGPDPIPALCATARNLERAGADFIAMPCNTVHYFWRVIQDCVTIPVIDMIAVTAARLQEGSVGLLATTSTIQTELYDHACGRRGIPIITPDEHDQEDLMRLIWAIKAGEDDPNATRRFVEIARSLVKRGSQALIVGCTELSLLSGLDTLKVAIYDALDILAERCIELAQRPIVLYEAANFTEELEPPRLTVSAAAS